MSFFRCALVPRRDMGDLLNCSNSMGVKEKVGSANGNRTG